MADDLDLLINQLAEEAYIKSLLPQDELKGDTRGTFSKILDKPFELLADSGVDLLPRQPSFKIVPALQQLNDLLNPVKQVSDSADRLMTGKSLSDYEKAIKSGDPRSQLFSALGYAGDILTVGAPYLGLLGAGEKSMLKAAKEAGISSQAGIFGGIKAKNAPLDDLAKAKTLIDAGTDPKQVWKDTGWYQAPWDKKWRFEIPDNEAVMFKPESIKLQEQIDDLQQKIEPLEKKWWKNELNPEQQTELDQLLNQKISLSKNKESLGGNSLDDVLAHEKLYENYPLDYYRIKQTPTSPMLPDAYITPDKEIGMQQSYWNPENPKGRSFIMHEAQHGIQDIEKFAPGGNIELGAIAASKRFPPKNAEELSAKIKELEGFITNEKKIIKKKRGKTIEDWQIENKINSENQNMGYWKDSTGKEWTPYAPTKLLEQLKATLEAGDKTVVPYEDALKFYQRIPGEAESRLVQKRLDYTPQQRRDIFPLDDLDVPLDELLPADTGSGVAMSVKDLPMDEASRLQRAKEMGFDTDKTWYHGTGSNIEEFDPKFLGLGRDQYGSGFYFTNSKDYADRYARPKDWSDISSDPNLIPKGTANTIEAYLKLKKPVPSEGKLSKAQIRKLIKDSPELDENLWNFGDYSYEGKNKVIENAVNAYYEFQSKPINTLNNLSNDFYRGHEGDFLKKVTKHTGWDHNIDRLEGRGDIVAVFQPNQIRSTEAAFDPSKADSGNLLASITGLLALGGASDTILNGE